MSVPIVSKIDAPDVFDIQAAEEDLVEKLTEAEKYATDEGTEHSVFFCRFSGRAE